MENGSRPLVLFGAGENAAVAHFYLTHDGDRRVAAFTVDARYVEQTEFMGLPVVPFEEVETRYPPSEHDLFVAVGYAKMNTVRERKCAEAKERGYRLATYVSSRATTWPDLSVGENCFILEDNTIQPFVKIGSGVTLWSGNHIGHHTRIGDFCFITSHVVVSGGVTIRENCFIGVNATLRDHITVARHCVIGAASLILHDTQEKGVYIGNPAKLTEVPSDRLEKV